MIKSQPIIGVQDVEKSSAWYQKLLSCKGVHGGSEFEMLADESDEVFLCLHNWDEHQHPTLSGAKENVGTGLILYLRVEDLDTAWEMAGELNAKVEQSPQINPNSGQKQFAIRDLDGYYLMISL